MQKQISKFSGVGQFCLVFLLLAIYFATDCRFYCWVLIGEKQPKQNEEDLVGATTT